MYQWFREKSELAMIRVSILVALAALSAFASPLKCIDSPCSVSSNFSADILGDPDTRADTWGRAGATAHRVTFRPPAGYRVRVLRVYGDFLIWPMGKVEPGRFAGALWGLTTTGPDGSIHADWAADNTMIYVQVATGGQPARAPVNFKTEDGGLLGPDHVLVSKMAVWLNDTGLKIHMEPSFTVVFRYEKQ